MKFVPKIGITIGDLNGIGVEIIIKTFEESNMFNFGTPILYGSSKIIAYYKNVLNLQDFRFNQITNIDHAKSDRFNVLNCWTDDVFIKPGISDPSLGHFARKSLEAVAYDCKQGKLDGIVTAPVSKFNLNTKDEHFSGQTEFFAEKFDCPENLMFMVSQNMKVALVTNHEPIDSAASKVTKEQIKVKVDLLTRSLQQDFLIERPKIAVLALNPHAGEQGNIGTQEQEIIEPCLEELKKKGQLVYGPYSADAFFGSSNYRNFDAILAMYHDQGLIPFKFSSFGEGVNYTAGMPYVRTSPDHGPGFDIAGKGIAQATSFQQAFFTASDIIKNRKEFAEMNSNPIKKQHQQVDRSENLEQ